MIKGFHTKPDSIKQPSLFPAKEKQRARLVERKNADAVQVAIANVSFVVHPSVYQTGVDTELMAAVVSTRRRDAVLEVGCGCGAVALLVAKRCRSVFGVDVNPLAVANASDNKRRLSVENVSFVSSDVFDAVSGKYDVIICNPPYNNYGVSDNADRMFWDPDDEMKRRFFRDVTKFLKARGKVYFGWADFSDLDGKLPMQLAESAGLRYVRHYMRPAPSGLQRFYVIEFHASRRLRHRARR